MNHHRQTVRQRLDQRLTAIKPPSRFAVPAKGWVRAIRDALGMSAVQLGKRLGVTPQSVADLEKSEVHGTVQLKTLRRAAESLDCTLVYALLPNSSLEDTIQRRAHTMARDELTRIGHSMDLEAQGLSEAEQEAQIETYIRDHLTERDLWERA